MFFEEFLEKFFIEFKNSYRLPLKAFFITPDTNQILTRPAFQNNPCRSKRVQNNGLFFTDPNLK